MRTKYSLLLVFLTILVASFASASTVTLTGISGQTLTYSQTGYAINTASTPGQFALASDDLSIEPWGYCVEQGVSIWPGEAFVVTDYEDISGAFVNAAWLVHTYMPQMTEGHQRAALQLAIWDVLYDADSALADGEIDEIYDIVPPSVQVYFDTIKADYDTNYDENDVLGQGYKIARLDRNDLLTPFEVQDILVRTVPEPGAMILFGFGLLGLSAVGRRKA